MRAARSVPVVLERLKFKILTSVAELWSHKNKSRGGGFRRKVRRPDRLGVQRLILDSLDLVFLLLRQQLPEKSY
jgi:hypothetical protein